MNKKLTLSIALLALLSSCGSSVSSSLSTSQSDGSSLTSQTTSYFSYDSNVSYQTYTVTFVTNADVQLDPVITSIIETMPTLENGSLTLEGWYFDAEITQPVNFPLFVDRDMTLYAKWIDATPGFVFKPTLDGQGYYVESYTGNATSIAIQSTYNGKPVLELGEYLFYNNGALLSIALPSQLRTIAMAAFKNATQLSNIVIPNSVIEIKADAFSGAVSLSSITMSTSIATIGNNAFENLPNLTTIDLPASLLELRARAFGDATNLTQVKIRATTPPLRFANSFENTPANLQYLVPAAVVSIYKNNEYWIDFSNQIFSL
jgi:hypothetical protein